MASAQCITVRWTLSLLGWPACSILRSTSAATLASVAACNQLEGAFFRYTQSVHEGKYDFPIVDAAIDALRAAMRDSLKELDTHPKA